MSEYREIDIARLHDEFTYHENAGWLIGKRDYPQRKQGDVVGCVDAYGYAVTTVGGRNYKVHRIIWAMHYGEWPDGLIDHINGNTLDNRICNMRIVCKSKNSMNSKTRSDNISGARGVCWKSDKKKWKAYLTVNAKQIHLGYFDSFDDAVKCREIGQQKHFAEYARAA